MTREEIEYLQDVVDRFKSADKDFYGEAEVVMNVDECDVLEKAISALSIEGKKDCRDCGEWIITYPNGKYNPLYECPFCKASNNAVFKNFCPNCGADMRGKAK